MRSPPVTPPCCRRGSARRGEQRLHGFLRKHGAYFRGAGDDQGVECNCAVRELEEGVPQLDRYAALLADVGGRRGEGGPQLQAMACVRCARPQVLQVVREWHVANWFTGAAPEQPVHQRTGTKPRNPLGDLVVANVFSRLMRSLPSFMRVMSPTHCSGWRRRSWTTWCFFLEGAPLEVLHSPMQRRCASLGPHMNFERGKTEGMAVLRGKGRLQAVQRVQELSIDEDGVP